MSKPTYCPGAPRLLAAISCVLSLAAPAFAQNAPAATNLPDPLDTGASVPAGAYRSSLSNYRMLVDEKVGNWKETNDTAGRIGGWRMYAKEARQPDSTPTLTPAPAMGGTSNPSGHDGHGAK